MIVKTTKGYQVRSEDGSKNLSADNLTKEQAQKRLAEVEAFKHMKKGLSIVIEDHSYALDKFSLTVPKLYIKLRDDSFEKALKAKGNLQQKKILVERDGKTFMMTVYVRPYQGGEEDE